MIRALLFLCLLAPGIRAAEVVDALQVAQGQVEMARALLSDVDSSRDRVAALTASVRAFEAGLTALRGHIRDATLEEQALSAKLEVGRADLARLLGGLALIEAAPNAPGIGPRGPLATARAGMVVSEVVPAYEARVSASRRDLESLSAIRDAQGAAHQTFQAGLAQAQSARAALSNAIAARIPPSGQTSSDAATLQALANGARSLGAFAELLVASPALDNSAFETSKGRLPLPVAGQITQTTRDGFTLATIHAALVTAPHASTVRYAGPLSDYGMVTILEPESGYLIILSGLAELFVSAGEVLPDGAPIGLMGRSEPSDGDKVIDLGESSGQDRPERLYIELRHGAATLNPELWFDLPQDKDKL